MEEKQIESKSPVPQKSPVITKPREMKFTEIIEHLLTGKKITKLEWKDKNYYAILDHFILKLHKPDGKLYNWAISEGDIIGTDYIIIS